MRGAAHASSDFFILLVPRDNIRGVHVCLDEVRDGHFLPRPRRKFVDSLLWRSKHVNMATFLG